MNLADYLSSAGVRFDAAPTKNDCLEKLVDLAMASGRIPNREEFASAISHREELMSTGIGLGIGVPHVRLTGVSVPVVVVGICSEGVQGYESIDGQPVQIVVLIVAGRRMHTEYIRLLAATTRLLKIGAIRERLLAANEGSEIHHILTEANDA